MNGRPNGRAPVLTVVAGPNGSGKTTLSRELLKASAAVHINPDDMAKALATETGKPLAECERLAFRRSIELQKQCQDQMRSYSYETVMSHEAHLDRMQTARSKGYVVRLIYVYLTSADENVARVRQRVREGGHDIPEEKIRSRYKRSLRLLPRAVAGADATIAMTNEGVGNPAAPRLIGHSGLIQVEAELSALLLRVGDPGEQDWEALGFHRGLTWKGWTEFAADPGRLATNRLRLADRRNDMLRAFG